MKSLLVLLVRICVNPLLSTTVSTPPTTKQYHHTGGRKGGRRRKAHLNLNCGRLSSAAAKKIVTSINRGIFLLFGFYHLKYLAAALTLPSGILAISLRRRLR